MTYKSRQAQIDSSQKKQFEQDKYGYISPNLARLRSSDNLSREETLQLRNIERSRRHQSEVSSVEIPQVPSTQSTEQLAYRNNNPGNLKFREKFIKQEGILAYEGDSGFAGFVFPEHGFLALQNRIRESKAKNQTIEGFISEYAPAYDGNNTERYISDMENFFNVSRSTPLAYLETKQIAKFISHKESQTRVDD